MLSNFSQFEVQSAANTLNDQDSTIIGQYQSTCIAVDYANLSQNKTPQIQDSQFSYTVGCLWLLWRHIEKNTFLHWEHIKRYLNPVKPKYHCYKKRLNMIIEYIEMHFDQE